MSTPLGFDLQGLEAEERALQDQLSIGLRLMPTLGPIQVGATERVDVWSQDKVTLYRFVGEGQSPSSPCRQPLLIVYALVNRPYMVDLQKDRSLVQQLLALGHDVYVIDWGYPDRADQWLELSDYISRYLHHAVLHLCQASGQPAIDILGVCQGGVFSLCYAALEPQRVRNLITMVTPVDFHTEDNLLGRWARSLDVDLMARTLGNIPADLMNISYLMLKPFRLNIQKYQGLLDILHDAEAVSDFLRMEQWIFDSPDLAGAAFTDFIKQFYQANGLVNGSVRIGDRPVDLGRVMMPVLNLYAEKDHLVPPAATRAMAALLPEGDYTEHGVPSGHIGIYVSSRAQREVPRLIHDWLSQRDAAGS